MKQPPTLADDELRLANTAYGQIAATLNREGVPSPRMYWSRITGKDNCKAAQLWSYATIKYILNKAVYICTHTNFATSLWKVDLW